MTQKRAKNCKKWPFFLTKMLLKSYPRANHYFVFRENTYIDSWPVEEGDRHHFANDFEEDGL